MAEPLTSTSGPPAGDLTGRLLAGRYRLNQMIASGGMAQVWDATDEVLARRVAVKVLHQHLVADQAFVERFRAEAVAAARLAHPSIVSIYDTFHDQAVEAIVMELVLGITLRTRLDQHGALEVSEALAIGAQIADALGEAHRSGLVHRDVKPANILLSVDGRVLIADFGIAKAPEAAEIGGDGLMVGTAKYLAPEQVEDKHVDGRTDIYALGVVLYEALCGRPPFVADTDVATALLRLHTPPLRLRQMRAGIPRPVEDVVLTAMARDPDKRYQDADALRRALVEAGADPEGAAPAPSLHEAEIAVGATAAAGAPEPSFAQTERRWMVPVLLVIVVAVALGVAGVLLGQTKAGKRLFESVRGQHPAAEAKPLDLPVTGAQAFDPFGGDGEHNDQARLAIDDDPNTSWNTETYLHPNTVGGKPGVGLSLTLKDSASLSSVALTTPTAGWAVSVYLVDGPPPDALAGWGTPVASQPSGQAGVNHLDLGGHKGRSVLLWFTRLSGNGRVTVSGVGVSGK